ncbi:hypothetical protein BC941DRAFT_398873 [Chlamydoabsidia padenii]|nr:hypothetical protein BC941DRAFT_398873 [Chlamydoabsidia padenii]
MSKHSSFSLHFLSNQKRKELQDLFATFDKDHNDKISTSELRTMLGSTGINEAQTNSVLDKVHTDNEGNLTFDEFAKLMKPTLHTPLRLTSKQQELLDTFKVFDKDGDGVINAKELTAMMHQLGDRITMEEAKQLISDVDDNHDGVVGFDEFARMMGVQPPESPTPSKQQTSHHRFFWKKSH